MARFESGHMPSTSRRIAEPYNEPVERIGGVEMCDAGFEA
jgi:hypothetical protein